VYLAQEHPETLTSVYNWARPPSPSGGTKTRRTLQKRVRREVRELVRGEEHPGAQLRRPWAALSLQESVRIGRRSRCRRACEFFHVHCDWARSTRTPR
jgi:hypothetical protein